MKPLPIATPAYDRDNEQRTRTDIQRAIERITLPAPVYRTPETLLNGEQRTIDNASDPTHIREVLATLIKDLQAKGIVG